MSRSKRKTTKRKSSKNKKKKHLNAGRFFAFFISILLIAIVYYFYQHEIQKRNTGRTPQQTQSTPSAKTRPKVQGSKPKPGSRQQKPKMPGRKKSDSPAVQRIIDYTNLEYPVSYSKQPEQIIFHTGHTVSYNKNWKIPNWVSYELTIHETMGEEKRSGRFLPDPHIKEGAATDSDYRRSGYDRGHMVPAADMKWSNTSMRESFYFSNICPQHPKLNQQRWKDLENKVREWAIADSAIIVICGPIVKDSPQCIGSNKVVVPHGFFKVVLSPYVASPKAIGFIFDNAHCSGPLYSHIVSVDSVEAITGLDFFAPLPNEIEDVLEAYIDTLYWGL